MKLLCAGGRDKYLNNKGYQELDRLHEQYNFTELVNGMAPGIDKCAYNWAKIHNIPIKEFPAKWKDLSVMILLIKEGKYGKYNALAGINRNNAMALYCDITDICVCFCGSSGTESMLNIATERGMKVIDFMDRKDLIK